MKISNSYSMQKIRCFMMHVSLDTNCLGLIINLNPSSVAISHRLANISILILEGIIKKISYDRCAYESVDDKSLSLAMSRKTTKKKKEFGRIKVNDIFLLMY